MRFAVTFSNGTVLAAHRKDNNRLIGPYTLSIKIPKHEELSVTVSTREDNTVKEGDVDEELLDRILESISDPSLTAYFLSDNRILQSDVFEEEPTDEWVHPNSRIVTRRIGDSIERMVIPARTRDLAVAPSVWHAESWLKQQAISASNAGQATMSNIYIDIIKRISKTNSIPDPEKSSTLDELMASLESLAARAEIFTTLGLSQPVPLKDLREIITSASAARRSLLASVLEPYVDSFKSRLDAYQELQ